VSQGFSPMVAAPVNGYGFSYTNFLYSFLPAILAMIVFLGIVDIDYAYRRLQPLASLVVPDGELAERSILLSYAADLPGAVTASAAINGHLRIAALSFASVIAAMIPVLAGGCFWAQFYIPGQSIRIYAHMPAYYALTVFVAIYAMVIAFCVFPFGEFRDVDSGLPRGNSATRWTDICSLVRGSRIVDDVQFRHPGGKIDLVTRLLSAPLGAAGTLGRSQEAAAASKISLADSVRGFGRARQQAAVGMGDAQLPRFYLGVYSGRDGTEGIGLDRLRS
jgi:hypothetical protein